MTSNSSTGRTSHSSPSYTIPGDFQLSLIDLIQSNDCLNSASSKQESSTNSESRWQQSQRLEALGKTFTKECRSCKHHLPLEQFPHFSSSKLGRKNTCKGCTNSLASLREALRAQNPTPPPGICPICKDHTDTWVLDHCHFSSTFRGYICNGCNLGLGRLNDNPRTLIAALRYLIN